MLTPNFISGVSEDDTQKANSELVVVSDSKLVATPDINLKTLYTSGNKEKVAVTVSKVDPDGSNSNFWKAAVTIMVNSGKGIITSRKAKLCRRSSLRLLILMLTLAMLTLKKAHLTEVLDLDGCSNKYVWKLAGTIVLDYSVNY